MRPKSNKARRPIDDIPPLDEQAMNPFDRARRRFHNMRAILAAITGAGDLLRTDAESALSMMQRAQIEIIMNNAHDLLEEIDRTRNELLGLLATAPATGNIHEIACRVGSDTRQDILDRDLLMIRQRYGLGKMATVILVAEIDTLTGLRRIFQSKGWRVRTATDPIDVHYLVQSERTDVIAMAPPASSETQWWLSLRIGIEDISHQPILLNLTPLTPGG